MNKTLVIKVQSNVAKRLKIIKKELTKEEDEKISYNRVIKYILKCSKKWDI